MTTTIAKRMRAFATAGLTLVLLSSAALSQTRTDLIDIPPMPAAAQWSWPAEYNSTLPNGLRATVITKPDEALATVGLFVPAGTLVETAETKGAANLVLAWLRAGSSRQPDVPLELRVEGIGADVQASANRFGSTITCNAMLPRLAGCLSLLADLVQFPAFKKETLLPIRSQLATQVRQQLASDEGRARAHFYNLTFGDEHPAGQTVVPDDVGGISEAALRDFWSRWYRPQFARLVIVGNVVPANAQKAASLAFRNWKGAPTTKPSLPALPQREGSRFLLVDQPGAAQATIMLGQMVAARTSKEIAALEALTFLFGGAGLGSRLALDVATRGLVLAAGASLEPAEEGRLLRVTMQSPPAKAWDAVLAAANQLKALQQQGVTALELAELKARSAAIDPFALETGLGLANAVLDAEPSKLGGLGHLMAVGAAMASLDQQTFMSHASLLKPDALTIVIIGPAAVIAPKLKAAHVRFEQIAADDPVSALARARRRQVVQGATENQQPSLQAGQARALIIKALAAAGGAPAWRELATLKVTKRGQRRDGPQILTMKSTTYYRRPSDLRVEQQVEVRGKTMAQGTFVISSKGVNGTDAKGKMGPLPSVNVASLRSAAFEDVLFVLLNALDAKPALPMTIKESWVEQGVAYPGLELQVPSGAWLSLYFDPQTHLLSRIRSPDLAGGQTEQRLSDWREVSGLKFPFKQVSLGMNSSDAVLVDVQVNPALEPKLFE